jgi:FAD:protein FMN transferase
MIHRFEGLGTHWAIQFPDNDQHNQVEVIEAVQNLAKKFETDYSRFLQDSLVSKLNLTHNLTNFSQEFVHMLLLGKQWYEFSNRNFNILVGDYLEKSGYNNQYSFSDQEISQSQIGNPLTDIIITTNKIELLGNSKLDLGGIGKGFLVDKIKEMLRNQYNIWDFVINGGGDIYISSSQKNPNPSQFYIQNPVNSSQYIKEVMLRNQALCTSASHKRSWRAINSGQSYDHFVNANFAETNTQFPKVSQASVIATSCVIADIMATCICLKGLNIDWIKGIQKLMPENQIEVYAVVGEELFYLL